MLTDESISSAQNLLAKQFPVFSMHQFKLILVGKPCIQLFHAGSMHWMCISNLETDKCDNGNHYVYDSLCKTKIIL